MNGNQKFCHKCGNANPIDAAFCGTCGYKFADATQDSPHEAAIASSQLQRPQSDFVTLACPNCGGKLNITSDQERFTCGFCSYEHIVRRNNGVVSLEPVVRVMKDIESNISNVGAGLNKIGFSSEKQVAEQTIVRLKEEIADLSRYLAEGKEGSDAAQGLFISMTGLSILFIIITFIKSWSFWVLVPSGLFLIIGIGGLISLRETVPEVIQAKQKLKEKQEELERNYDIVRRSH